jgi:hypothetical protein
MRKRISRVTGVLTRIAVVTTVWSAVAAAVADSGATNTAKAVAVPPAPTGSGSETNLPAMEVAQAVMVTAELDFGAKAPSIADALRQIERRYQPDDKSGRTFAILDAYGEPTADGKLHISMHVSLERPGIGALVFRRTGEILWKTRIVPATHPPSSSFAGKNLFVLLDDGHDKPYVLDGSKVSTSIMDATVRDLGEPVREFWPDGEERELTFFYSACGCPVKVMARRLNDKTRRTKELPVIFPDDPDVAATISRLAGWE